MPEVLTRLAYLEQAGNRLDRAEALYEHSIDIDPSQPVAATNLGVILAERGLTVRALDVWRPAFARHPEASELGLDLALAAAGRGTGKTPRTNSGLCSRTIRISTPLVRWPPRWHAALTPAAATDQVSRRPSRDSAACAAARRATGTRNGEQLT